MHRYTRWIPPVLLTIGLITGIIIFTLKFRPNNLPCDFFDSINITDGALHSDLSITYDNITFQKNQYAKIDYILEGETKTHTSMPYLRGCICNIKPCMRLCCPSQVLFDENTLKCTNQTHAAAKLFESDVIDEHNHTQKWILDHHFAYVHDKPCDKKYFAEGVYNITHVIIINLKENFKEHF